MDAFDTDVLIYAALSENQDGRRVRALFSSTSSDELPAPVGIGSVLLLPELLSKPVRDRAFEELRHLAELLGRLELIHTDRAIADLAVDLGARYRLRGTDAVHLATAVNAGADRFITNNSKDFDRSITEIDITYPMDLADPLAG